MGTEDAKPAKRRKLAATPAKSRAKAAAAS